MTEDSADQGPDESSPRNIRTGARAIDRGRRTGTAVLLVEDDELMRASIRATLLRWGHSVDPVADGIDALRRLAQRAYDIIITDVRMPLMDGVSLWRRATNAGHPGAWILMTGATMPRIEREVPILHKPFRLIELRDVLERATLGEKTRPPSQQGVAAERSVQSSINSKRE